MPAARGNVGGQVMFKTPAPVLQEISKPLCVERNTSGLPDSAK